MMREIYETIRDALAIAFFSAVLLFAIGIYLAHDAGIIR